MKKLINYTKNPFFTIEVSRDRVQKFTFNHIQRMKADGNPNLAGNITATELCWEALFGNLETYDSELNQQMSFTIQVKDKIEEFKAKALEMEPLVDFKFKKGSGTYTEIYPGGRTEFHKANQSEILLLMERMVNASHTYAADLGVTWEPEFIALRDDFMALFASQQGKMGEVDLTIPDYAIKRDNLYVQLSKNMYLILHENSSNPIKLLAFYDETMVNYEKHPGEGETGYILTILKMSQAVADISFSPDDTLLIRSNSEKELKFYFTPDPAMPPMVVPTILAPNAEIEVKCSDAGAPTNKFLIFINGNDTDGEVEITLI